GSLIAPVCFYTNFTNALFHNDSGPGIDVSGTGIYANASNWCNYTAPRQVGMGLSALGLPDNIFFICGDRAWKGIPGKAIRGPCTFGHLTLLHPDKKDIANWTLQHHRNRRAMSFNSDCDSNINFWNAAEIISASIFAPGVAAAKALATLNRLGCWLAKQPNATSAALSGLLLDVDSVRHATLQNRAAIDFLLAQGHGCEDFDGMCCMNLSDHSESIHASIAKLKEGVNKLQIDDASDWFNRLFQSWGVRGWLASILKTAFIVVLSIVCLLLI
ncbi:ENR1 protein, partial [Eolophus roseicapillus]|nr:ENR1 protein [Eolophus roseicapilla]